MVYWPLVVPYSAGQKFRRMSLFLLSLSHVSLFCIHKDDVDEHLVSDEPSLSREEEEKFRKELQAGGIEGEEAETEAEGQP